jgi:hypothetical protein
MPSPATGKLEQSVGCVLLPPENWSSRSDAFSCHRKIGAVGRMHSPVTGKLEQSVGCILLPPENWSSRSDAFSCYRKIGAVGRMHSPATGKLRLAFGCIHLPSEFWRRRNPATRLSEKPAGSEVSVQTEEILCGGGLQWWRRGTREASDKSEASRS